MVHPINKKIDTHMILWHSKYKLIPGNYELYRMQNNPQNYVDYVLLKSLEWRH